MKTVEIRKPHPLLNSFVEYFYFCRGEGLAYSDGVVSFKGIPSGYAQLAHCRYGREKGGSSQLLIQGPRMTAQEIPLGMVEVAGFFIRPGALGIMAGAPAQQLTNQLQPLETLWGKDALELLGRMTSAGSYTERWEILEKALLQRVENLSTKDLFVVEAAKIIEDQKGKGNLESFLKQVGYSRSSVLRKFKAEMGLTPKQYGRIVRFRQIFNEIKPGEEIHWARLASQHGYFDQSHLAHDFQELMGQYPAEFAEDFRKRAYFIPGQMTKELIVYFKSESEFRKSLAMEGSDSKLNDGTDWGSNRRWFGEKLQYTGFDLA